MAVPACLQVFAVLSPSGIYYGQLNLDPSLPDETDHLQKHHLLPAAVMQPQQLQPGLPVTIETPLSLVRGALCCFAACGHGTRLQLCQQACTCPNCCNTDATSISEA